MPSIEHLLERNRAWAAAVEASRPGFFRRLAAQQTPKYLWIGCADSRVPANEVIDLDPGEVFVHRNVANVVVHTDFNCLAVLQYAVDVLKVEHVMVVGHYGCGGIKAALEDSAHGLIDNWLAHVQDVASRHAALLDRLASRDDKADLLCELNVVEQVANLARTTIVQDAWRRGHPVELHGLIYGLVDGRLKDLGIGVASAAEAAQRYPAAIEAKRGWKR
ncbi:MAG: carbonate dehydratase [Betaproteobacteria bacterium]|jgi:carbonic anhydrase|nr:carbonate dehydratase [Betaproteobacteria bacterium]